MKLVLTIESPQVEGVSAIEVSQGSTLSLGRHVSNDLVLDVPTLGNVHALFDFSSGSQCNVRRHPEATRGAMAIAVGLKEVKQDPAPIAAGTSVRVGGVTFEASYQP